jgi:hypothetical protein
LQQAIAAAGSDAVQLSARLVDYFWCAQQHYLTPDGTLAYYPGHPSIYGARCDAVEGVSRLMPLWAAYASSPYRDDVLAEAMLERQQRTLANGCDPSHPGYWGDIDARSTLICEGADIALAIWLGKETLWPGLGTEQQRRARQWLGQAVGKDTADNNWHLFVVLIDLVLADLDPDHRFSSGDRLARVREFMRSDGCFTDGPDGQVDFYNAWGFHYALFWIQRISRGRVGEFADTALRHFCAWYQYLFTSAGLPLFGRSLSYRFAAPAPLLCGALEHADVVTPGVALHAYLATWRFFAGEGGLQYGRPTQGVFGDDARWLDPYSGPASSLWGTRALVLFYFVARHLDWRTVEVEPLPAERGDVEIAVRGLGARVGTRAAAGESWVSFDTQHRRQADIELRRPSWRERARALAFASAARPANNLQEAGLGRFSSRLDVYR